MVRRLLPLNGLATIGVVLNHSIAWGYIALFWWTHRYRPVSTPNFDQMGSANYYSLRLVEQVIAFTIPAFLFISGFFIAFATRQSQKAVGWRIVITRIVNLVIPYIIWSFIYLGVYHFLGQTFPTSSLFKVILTGRAADPFYYIPVLVQLYLLSPFLVLAAKSRWKVLLLASVLVQLVIELMYYTNMLGIKVAILQPFIPLAQTWLFPGLIVWFVFGIIIGFHGETLRPFVMRFRWVWAGMLLIFLLAGILEWEWLLRASGKGWLTPKITLVDCFYAAAFLLTFLAFDQVTLPGVKILGNLGSKSYGVYLIHSLVLIFTSKLIYHIFPALLPYQFVFQSILIFLALTVPLGMMALVKRLSFSRLYGYLFG